jgi:ATP adenylyltransferase
MSLKQLWAPWRMEYLEENKPEKKGCVFCVLPKETEDRKNLILHRGERVFVIMNKFPYNNGHVMVVPNRHVADMSLVPDDDLRDLFLMSKHVVQALKDAYAAPGFNIGMNVGEAGGAGIREHLHLHVVPRWLGDTNFLPVLGETKSMPQHLMTSYDALKGYFGRL